MRGTGRLVVRALSSGLLVVVMNASPQAQVPAPTAVPGFYAGLDKDAVAVKRGEAAFFRDCSFCHLPRIRKAGPLASPGPNLSGLLKDADKAREDRARQFIMTGSDRMPAWRYSLKPAEIDDLITYMRTQ